MINRGYVCLCEVVANLNKSLSRTDQSNYILHTIDYIMIDSL